MRTYAWWLHPMSKLSEAQAEARVLEHDLARATKTGGLAKELQDEGVFYVQLSGPEYRCSNVDIEAALSTASAHHARCHIVGAG